MLLMVLAPASAFDFLYTDDFAPVTDEGIFKVKVFPVYAWANSAFDADGESQEFEGDQSWNAIMVPVELAYGVIENLEIAVQPKFVRDAMNSVPIGLDETEDQEGSGIGDTWVKAKYAYPLENGAVVAGRVGAKLPTGDDEPDEGDLPTGSGQTDVDVAALVNYTMEQIMINGALGYRIRMENDAEYKPGNEFHFMGEFGYMVNEQTLVSLGFDGFFGADNEMEGETAEESASNAVAVSPGVVYHVSEALALKGDFFIEVLGQNKNAEMGVNVGAIATF
jgi:hypothetical protein